VLHGPFGAVFWCRCMPILILTNQGPKKTGRCLGFLEECIHTDTVEYHRYRPRLSTVSVCLSAPVPSPLFFFPFVQRRILGKTGLDTASLNPVGGLYIEVDLNSFICIMIILREKKLSYANLAYLSRNPCWATTALVKIHSPLAKSHQIITVAVTSS
jgi:hypothetical protein